MITTMVAQTSLISWLRDLCQWSPVLGAFYDVIWLSLYFYVFIYFGYTKSWTQDLAQAKKAHYAGTRSSAIYNLFG